MREPEDAGSSLYRSGSRGSGLLRRTRHQSPELRRICDDRRSGADFRADAGRVPEYFTVRRSGQSRRHERRSGGIRAGRQDHRCGRNRSHRSQSHRAGQGIPHERSGIQSDTGQGQGCGLYSSGRAAGKIRYRFSPRTFDAGNEGDHR